MDLSQVTLAQMRYALAVAGKKNFRSAAADCHVSQSGLSMQIQKLEELLGVALFDRSKKPVLQTQEGMKALEQMRTVIRETERLGQLVSEKNEPAGPYRLGVIPTLSPTVLPLFLGEFIRTYPQVELIVSELTTAEIISRLQSDSIDAGLAATPLQVPGLLEDVLGIETLHAYLPPKDPLLKRKKIRQQDLQGHKLWVMPEGHCFRTQVLSYCSSSHLTSSGPIRFESGNFQTLIHLVDDGLGATILPALVAKSLAPQRQKAQLRPLTSPTPAREIGLVRSRRDLRKNVSLALIETLRAGLQRALDPPARKTLIVEPLSS